MKKNKTYAGYINLKPINGIIFPSYIQNQMNKKFIVEELESDFFLSTNENMYSENDIVLNSLIKERNNLNGIVMLSAFSLPEKFYICLRSIDVGCTNINVNVPCCPRLDL